MSLGYLASIHTSGIMVHGNSVALCMPTSARATPWGPSGSA